MKLPERLELARTPVPLHLLQQTSAAAGKRIWLWRDDLTGFELSGNKIRKLEFLLAEALQHGATHLVTCGGPQSNHARATAFAARRLGLGITIVMREPKTGWSGAGAETGNFFLDRMLSADVRRIAFTDYQRAGSDYTPFLTEEAQRIAAAGGKPYVVPEGGSNALGAFGYIRGVSEMLTTFRDTAKLSRGPDSIFLALGSGGTHAGMVLGAVAAGLSARQVYAVNVCDSREYFEKRVGGIIAAACDTYGLSGRDATLQIFDGHFGDGYALATDAQLQFYRDFARTEGILLDPVYTGKAFIGMLAEIKNDPSRFGDDIVFLHSGGAFGLFAYADRLCALDPA
jgi:D-cysteine desulfhydrase